MKLLLIIVPVLAVVAAKPAAPTQDFFRSDYTYYPEEQAFFKAHHVKLSWHDAVSTCLAEGARLATPASQQEAEKLVDKLDHTTFFTWIGIHDNYAEGDFITIDGIPISDTYTNWANGEPNDARNNEDCVLMTRSGTYNDDYCFNKFHFVCKRDKDSVTSNPACETYDLGYEYFPSADRCYKFHAAQRNWSDAFRICRAEQAHLAVINSADEANLFVELFARHPENSLKQNMDKSSLLLGFSDIITNSHFITAEGLTLAEAGYEEWSNGQPDNLLDNEHCGSMFRNGKLNDFNCKNRAPFLCEKVLGGGIDLRNGYGVTRRAGAPMMA